MIPQVSKHGGEIQQAAERLGVPSSRVLDASASLVPWTPRLRWRLLSQGLRDYPTVSTRCSLVK